MKDGLRFVDCDMHIMEPPDLFERYLDPKFKDRVSVPVGADGRPKRGMQGMIFIDGLPTSDIDLQQYRKRARPGPTQSTQPLSGSRLADTGRLDFAIERDYNAEAQVMGMAMEGVDIAVLYPTTGLSLIARDNLDPQLSLALCQAYNNWIHEFCRYSPERLKFVAMLPMHDVHLACRELVRCVRELGAVGSFIRPNLVNGRYWHSNYWDPLYSVHEGAGRDVGLPRGRGRPLLPHERALRREPLLPPRRQPLDRDAAGADRDDHRRRVRVPSEAARRIPRGAELVGARAAVAHRVGLSAVPRDARALSDPDAAKEYFRRNCWAAVEGSEPEIEATAGLIGADRMCISTDYPHFDSNFPHVAENLLKNVPRAMAAQIFMGGAHLYGFTEADFKKADAHGGGQRGGLARPLKQSVLAVQIAEGAGRVLRACPLPPCGVLQERHF